MYESMNVFMLLCIYVCMYFDFKAKSKCMGQISVKMSIVAFDLILQSAAGHKNDNRVASYCPCRCPSYVKSVSNTSVFSS